jgi:small subunit ribosomal protein S6
MSDTQTIYDLMLLLDPAAADEQKSKILADTEASITNGGELVGKHEYGLRQLTFEINKKKEAQYHLLQFHATPELLANLHRTLHITDGVLRFRIIKLAPGTPAPPDLTARPQSEEPAPAPSFEDVPPAEPAPAV